MEAVVDAHDEDERAVGWSSYLEDRISFPFLGRCIVRRRTNTVKKGETVQVIGIANPEECAIEIFVTTTWNGEELDLPLSQIFPEDVDEESEEAIGDWHYWVGRGYVF